MASMHPLSSKLKAFEESYSNFSQVKSSQGDVSSAVNDAINQLDSAINGFSKASSDAQGNQLNNCVSLVKSAAEVVKSHVEGDISALLANAAEVKATIDDIKDKISKGEAMDEQIVDVKADPDKGIPNDIMKPNPEVPKLNQEIDELN